MGVILCSTHGRQPIRLTCEHLAAMKPGPEAFRDARKHIDPAFGEELTFWYCAACADRYREAGPDDECPGVPVCSLCYPVAEQVASAQMPS